MRHTLSLFCFYKIFYFHPLTSIWNDNKRNFNARCFKRIDNLWKTKKESFCSLNWFMIEFPIWIYMMDIPVFQLRHNTNDIVKYKDSYWVPVIHPFNYTTDYRRLSLTHTHTFKQQETHFKRYVYSIAYQIIAFWMYFQWHPIVNLSDVF